MPAPPVNRMPSGRLIAPYVLSIVSESSPPLPSNSIRLRLRTGVEKTFAPFIVISRIDAFTALREITTVSSTPSLPVIFSTGSVAIDALRPGIVQIPRPCVPTTS